MKKSNIKKIILISIVIIIAAFGIFMVVSPQISVRDNTTRENTFGDGTSDAYALGYNIYGQLIFKNNGKALKQFKKDYAVTLDYLEQCGYGKFSTDYDTLQDYAIYSWQHTVEEGTENEELIKSQLGYVSGFLDLYGNSDYRTYNFFSLSFFENPCHEYTDP